MQSFSLNNKSLKKDEEVNNYLLNNNNMKNESKIDAIV